METRPDLGGVEDFCKMLVTIREEAIKIDDIKDIVNDLSFSGPRTWARKILGDRLASLIDYPDMEDDMMRDFRLVQNLIYMM